MHGVGAERVETAIISYLSRSGGSLAAWLLRRAVNQACQNPSSAVCEIQLSAGGCGLSFPVCTGK